MNEPKKKLTEEELKLIEETELFMKEVYSNPDVANAKPSADLHDKVFAEIRAREAAKREQERMEEKRKAEACAEERRAAEEQELIRLGRIYKKRRKLQKYIVLAAVLVFVLAFGITSVGGPEKVFERIQYAFKSIEQTNVDSDHEDVSRTSDMDEEEAYQEIEDTFKITPVGLNYLPGDVEFLEAELGEEIQGINLIYGKGKEAKIIYFIRPSYRTSSFGKDIEDEVLEEYIEENEYTTIYIRNHLVNGEEERWSVQFEYKDVVYSMTIMNTSKSEVERIVKNLYFS